jgi:hypothetical protein
MTRIISRRIPLQKLTEADRQAPEPFKNKNLLGRFKSSGSSNDKVRAALKNVAHKKNR